MADEPNCGSCRYWTISGSRAGFHEEMRDCRRHSPVHNGNDRGRNKPAWPQTFPSDCCGDHEPVKEEVIVADSGAKILGFWPWR